MQQKHLIIKGKVQGVWYRGSMFEQAILLDIVGWVRNLDDGSVEAVVQGEPENIEKIIAWAKQGPENAEVSEVLVQEVDEDVLPSFKVAP